MPTSTAELAPRRRAGDTPHPDAARPGVIWITGFSGAGKTTVARKVKTQLAGLGINAILLDGDDLRAIFAGKWGYERADRIDLAHAYFRLCSTLAAQGSTVIISAIAMYQEVYTWVDRNVDRMLQVYLHVPEQERRERDRLTKNLYAQIGDMSKLYDEPDNTDLVVENYGSTTPDEAAAKIVERYLQTDALADKGRGSHWQAYYQSHQAASGPSSFAQSVQPKLPPSSRLLEVGCGNGRDAGYFESQGHEVHAIDASEAAIDICLKHYRSPRIKFAAGTLPTLQDKLPGGFDVVYSRFVLHAMTESEEGDMLVAAHRLMKPEARLFIECRSINDPMARLGEVISPTERIHGHYRRFIVHDELMIRLAQRGFVVLDSLEARNLAAYGDDNPAVIRVTARKA